MDVPRVKSGCLEHRGGQNATVGHHDRQVDLPGTQLLGDLSILEPGRLNDLELVGLGQYLDCGRADSPASAFGAIGLTDNQHDVIRGFRKEALEDGGRDVGRSKECDPEGTVREDEWVQTETSSRARFFRRFLTICCFRRER